MSNDFVYLRLIGDRSISKKDFDIIEKERKVKMQKWSKIFKDMKNTEVIVKTAVMSANHHHYVDLSYDCKNIFRNG